MNWINENILIDFELPRDIKEIADECERFNAEGNYAYDNYADLLGNMCKEAYRQGHLTRKQWDLMELRYIYGN
ncbi:MAG: hypothetical protein LUI07_02125 [Lachnospiraceae bacterium]|nr:hypothetical protein [Lachnospiraceae bacterium]